MGPLRSRRPRDTQADALKRDYRDMATMIFGDAPLFESLMEKLAVLEDAVNALPQPRMLQ